jgi:hypothetical protein
MTTDLFVTICFVAMVPALILTAIGGFGYMIYCERNGGTTYGDRDEWRFWPATLLVLRDVAFKFCAIPFLILFVMFLAGVLK